VDIDERFRAVKALEIGVNDILARPIDPGELAARVRTQSRRKRYTDYLRANLDHSLELAVTDQLTGLHNRRYMVGQLEALLRRSVAGGAPVSVLVIDIDHFKTVNDSFGHDVGDEVLREFAVRRASNVRAITCRCATAAKSSSWSCRTPSLRPRAALRNGFACMWPDRRSG